MSDFFRFQDFEIWKLSMALNNELFAIAQALELKRQFALSDQLRRASLSISNNIAEGSGSDSNKDFSHFLNIARRSVFECANMIYVLADQKMITENEKIIFLDKLTILSRKITNFKTSLK